MGSSVLLGLLLLVCRVELVHLVEVVVGVRLVVPVGSVVVKKVAVVQVKVMVVLCCYRCRFQVQLW